jgi:hypothetical protein
MSQQRWPILAVVAFSVALAPAVSRVTAQEESSRSRSLGKAVVEYRDDAIQVVAAYYYSQRNHDSRWLLIESALSTADPATIHRTAIHLRTPQGRDIALADQRRVGDDVNAIQQLLQNARTVRHDVASYFVQRDRVESMQFFTLPFGGVVHDEFVVDRDRVAVGPLFFESPTGAWERGTYTLVVRHPKGIAELPIRLE